MSSGDSGDSAARIGEGVPGGADAPAGPLSGGREVEPRDRGRGRGRGSARRDTEGTPNMLPGRERRRFGLERIVVRLVATFGVIGVGVLLGAILASSKVQGWIIGLVVAIVSVVLSGILWSSRQL